MVLAHGISANDFLFSPSLSLSPALAPLRFENNLAILGEEISYPNTRFYTGGLT